MMSLQGHLKLSPIAGAATVKLRGSRRSPKSSLLTMTSSVEPIQLRHPEERRSRVTKDARLQARIARACRSSSRICSTIVSMESNFSSGRRKAIRLVSMTWP